VRAARAFRGARFVRAKPERRESEPRLGVGVDVVVTHVGLELGRRAGQRERPFVRRAMMAVAQQHQVVGLVTAAGLARHDVMDFQVS
jgi:hypothetical protein